ncbi:MAG: LysR family transcriptional regulator [Candidatus Eremiobacteraeota bacterium]|nr:LysR family transcriptional regulator [Candidatus Eremiobacteraeota bacterium]MBC5820882.1 LysR family transcriptional regulator [Candidatus Eremiobacteraeota bacterium]
MATLPLNVNHLVVLAAVVEHGGYTRAAEAMGVSQPSISQQMRDLERTCGLPLVRQRGRRLEATHLGTELAALGRRIGLDAERGARLVAEHAAGLAGKLTVGASMTTAAYYVPRALVRLRAQRPALAVDLEIANTADVAQATVDELVDVGVVEGTVERPELRYVKLGDDRLTCIVPAAHALRERDVDVAALLHETLLLREPGSGTREAVVDALAARGVHFSATIDVGSNDAILQSVAEGLGIAWLSERAVIANRSRGFGSVRVTDIAVAREIGYVRRTDLALSPPAAAFVTALGLECALDSGAVSEYATPRSARN